MNLTEAKKFLGEMFNFSAVDTNKVIQGLNLPKKSNILDVGTGMGNLAITLALYGYKVLTGEPGDDESIYAKQNWHDSAKKVNVDHLIKYKSFDAKEMPFEGSSFDAIFSLGTFHHIEEADRNEVIKEFVRVTNANSIICFFEPNQKSIKIIREFDSSHSDAADPSNYIQKFNLVFRKIEGLNFNAFIFKKD